MAIFYRDKNWLSGLLGVFNIIGVLGHIIFCSENHALAQITPDGTLGNNSSRITPNINIKGLPADRIDGGATRGANLFHSFREFNVGELQRVYFANPTGISNILTRVTGSNVSNILGTLGVDGGANLFFLNPNGILFGNNARLDVAGSFVASTANSFVFGNGLEFSATNPQIPSALLTVNPSALLFNQLQAGRIDNRSIAPTGIDPAGFNAFGLRVGDGKSLLLVGGNVSIDGGQLNAYGGRVELGGLAAPGNVNLVFSGDNLSLKFPLNAIRASVSLTNQAVIYVEGAGDGDIAINARNLEILGGSGLSAGIGVGLGTPEIVAGDITLNATGEIKVAYSLIDNSVGQQSKGSGGNISINSGSISLEGSGISTSNYGQGNAGNVTLRAKDSVSLLADAYIGSTVDIFNITDQVKVVGNGGNIDINAGSLSLTNFAQLITSNDGQGNAGNVIVRVKDAVSFANDARILSMINARGLGNTGNIDINAASLSLTDGATLQTEVRQAGRGNAGNINVKVNGSVDIVGERNSHSGIFSTMQPETVGNVGNISINSGFFSLRDGARLQASTLGVGNAGNVTVRVKDSVSLTGKAYILSTLEAGGVGKGGNIDINAATLSLIDGAQLLTLTRGASATQLGGRGDAGNVNIKVTGEVGIAGEKNGVASAIFTNVEMGTVGNGGNITIDSGSFSLRDGAVLEASTFGVGNAGNVRVDAKDSVSLAGNAGIFSRVEAGGVGKGGNIDINAATLSLTDGAQLQTLTSGSSYTSTTQPPGQGDAGNVNIKVTGEVDIAGEKNDRFTGIFSRVETGTIGNGGNITVDSGSFSLREGALLLAATLGRGNAGSIRINVKDAVTISGTSQKTGLSSSLFTSTDLGSTGIGGDITVNTNIFHISNGALLDAGTASNTKGGDIMVNANIFEATGGGQLSTITLSNGNAGKITVNVTDKAIVSGSDPNFSDRITKFPDSISNIGANSGLFVSSTGSGITGDIEINSPKITLDNQGKLNAESASGNGGNINVNSDLLLLRRNSQISTNAGTEKLGGNGGNIKINSRFIVAVPKENSDISANAFTGIGGRVDITTNGIFGLVPQKSPTEKSDITASSELGVSGEVTINSPDTDPSRGLIQLPSNIVDVSRQIAQGCTPRGGQNASRFIATGRGGLPLSPNEPLRGQTAIAGWVDLPPQATAIADKLSTATMTKSSDRIVEAQGWIVDAKGDVILVAQSAQSFFIPSAMSCSQ
ncbi:MAG: filamentous hemagglutinin N-terminal domain-containing protein [Nostoc sp.]|uniref:two-partner secretion domain-containing protein n=1 Tax=Nostoc sp. TaxID=1180 RepID=UPI002FF4F123